MARLFLFIVFVSFHLPVGSRHLGPFWEKFVMPVI